MRTTTNRAFVFLGAICMVFTVAPAPASELSREVIDERGEPALRVTVSHPDRPVGPEHLGTVRLISSGLPGTSGSGTVRGGGTRPGRTLTSSRSAGIPRGLGSLTGLLPDASMGGGRGGEFSPPDMSGMHVVIEPLQAAACDVTGVGIVGQLRRGGIVRYEMGSASTNVSVLIPVKGNPDLYIVDQFNQLICASESSGKRAPENCAVWDPTCVGDYTNVDVIGRKKKNTFLLAVWLLTAN